MKGIKRPPGLAIDQPAVLSVCRCSRGTLLVPLFIVGQVRNEWEEWWRVRSVSILRVEGNFHPLDVVT